ncbi:RelA/SpoT domain-containing protein [Paenibacillus sp. FSL K6-2524]|uniref:RelA/SpoT domain-containing protein n=1 Tax=Paenibacillus sp. FSL K6-2524 TaxID=2954516 RepID=UPI0030F63107
MIPLSKNEFFERYHLPEEYKEIIDWDQMVKIYDHFLSIKDRLTAQAEFIAKTLRSNKIIHTVRSRLKDPEHLVEKMIRKTPQRKEQKGEDFCFSVSNYQEEITDLIGVRAIHIFKEDWEQIHNFISETWNVIENTANVRAGDNTERFSELDINVDRRKSGYRSVHYLIEFSPTSKKMVAEIQVRTIFEEGYGEIDHLLRYPHGEVPKIIELNLLLLNRIVGSSDEMASFLNMLKENLVQVQTDMDSKDKENKLLREKINSLKIEKSEKESILSSISVINERKPLYLGEPLQNDFIIGHDINSFFNKTLLLGSNDNDEKLKEIYENKRRDIFNKIESSTADNFYVLSKRKTIKKNTLQWWIHSGHGYTDNIDDAGIFTKEEFKYKIKPYNYNFCFTTDIAIPIKTANELFEQSTILYSQEIVEKLESIEDKIVGDLNWDLPKIVID